jgi:Nif-specific regulatory protein
MAGRTDPFQDALVGKAERRGPLLSLLDHVTPDRLLVLHRPEDAARAGGIAEEAQQVAPGLVVEMRVIAATDSASLREAFRGILVSEGANASSYEDPSCAVSFASGDFETRACWLSLAMEEGLAVQLLDVDPPLAPGSAPRCSRVRVVRQRLESGGGMVREPVASYISKSTARWTGEQDDCLEQARACGIIGEHPSLVRALEWAATVAAHDVPILIQGETGTGKGLLARFVHLRSGRPADRLVAVNCGALPENLIESILFGHTKGSFTGATADRPGKFELADGGTLFLDEIGELPVELQPKLLRVLEDGLVEPLGARQGRHVDVRIVAATNRDLQSAIADRTFREDLYYRLNYAVLHLPPLRERRSDISLLALHMLERMNRALRRPKSFTPEALAWLERQEWRGNVRDLENVVGRSALMAKVDVLGPGDIQLDQPSPSNPAPYKLPEPSENFSLDNFLRDARRELIRSAMDQAGGNQSAAARLLGITPQAVSKFLQAGE